MDSCVAFTLPPDVLQCRDPATSELLGEAPVFETADVDEAVARARRAQRHSDHLADQPTPPPAATGLSPQIETIIAWIDADARR